MKLQTILTGFVVVLVAVTLANLIALKIAADQVQGSIGTSPLLGLFGRK